MTIKKLAQDLEACYPVLGRKFFIFTVLHLQVEKKELSLIQHLDTLPDLKFVLNNSYMNITLKLTFGNCFTLANIFSNFLYVHFKQSCERDGINCSICILSTHFYV